MERGLLFTRLQKGVELSSLAGGCMIQRGYAVQGASVSPLSCPSHIGAGFDVGSAQPSARNSLDVHWAACCCR